MELFFKQKVYSFMLVCALIAGMLMPPLVVNAANGDTTVYITKTGEKYHADGCSSLKKSKIAISLTDAVAKGYEPCSKCNPGSIDASANVTTSATTKSKNMDSSSGYGFDTYNITEQQNTDETYVLNTSTLKIHHPNCKDVPKIKPSNYATSSESAETLISQGYSICGHCFK